MDSVRLNRLIRDVMSTNKAVPSELHADRRAAPATAGGRGAGRRQNPMTSGTVMAGRRPAKGEGRAAIVAATQCEIAPNGVGGTRLRSVARRPGLSMGSTTDHVLDRIEMINEALEEHAENIEHRAAQAVRAVATGSDASTAALHALDQC